jgi:glycosyltransferase involved in cell wall biosynthesis
VNGSRLTFSCILPTFNRSEVVEQSLRCLLAVDYPADCFEILVADNSTDDTPQMVERVARTARARVRLLRSDERLPAVKRNQAIRAAEADYVVLMNDDVWVTPSFLAEHERSQRPSPRPTAVLGHVEQSPAMPPTPFIEWYRPFAYHEIADRADRPVGHRYFWSMNLSLPRNEMLDRNLMFHEDWAEIGNEDIELGFRWDGAGNAVVYNPRAYGEHYHPHTLSSACRLQETVGRGLRDLEWLVPERDLLQRYGVLSARNDTRSIARGIARAVLFNDLSVPHVQRWLESRTSNDRRTRWLYWKVLLHYTNRGYRQAPPRCPRRLETGAPGPAVAQVAVPGPDTAARP